MLIKVSGPLSLENKGHVDIEFSAHDACKTEVLLSQT
jgi:hypothetical protein